jgi:hypothetical protein
VYHHPRSDQGNGSGVVSTQLKTHQKSLVRTYNKHWTEPIGIPVRWKKVSNLMAFSIFPPETADLDVKIMVRFWPKAGVAFRASQLPLRDSLARAEAKTFFDSLELIQALQVRRQRVPRPEAAPRNAATRGLAHARVVVGDAALRALRRGQSCS